ncbi:cell filamentation protein [Jatrophihabitans sp. GAS493]|uniref:Fic/DOC family protein n=1 Tax=Jatrophihabitans sp. GAS493 TaxID=1907575 RepID=UPI000BC07D7D|nr:Fic family protein [Jatrophihabitans sp. GAS493]SOD72905.1 cell filamentation protein [Jatrophihabitans sp. GAS493]
MSEPPRRYSWEDYLYPANEFGVQVLRNKLGLREFAAWHDAERQLTVLRAQELIGRPELVPRTFDVGHWKAIHRQIFQDVYEWAGEFRTVNISKAELVDGEDGKLKQQFNPFAPSDELEGYADAVLGHVRAADMFAGRDRAGVVDGLAESLTWMNRLHPFREGNGRTQRILAEHIADHAGYLLDWYRISPEDQNRVMAQSYHDDIEPLRDALEGAVIAIPRGGSLDDSPWPTAPTGPARAPNFWQFSKTGQQVLADAAKAAVDTSRAAQQQTSSRSPEPGYDR